MPEPSSAPKASGPKRAGPLRSRSLWVIAAVVVVGLIAALLLASPPGTQTVPYSALKARIEAGEVARVVVHQDGYIEAIPSKEYEPEPGEEASEVRRWRAARLALEDEGLIPLLDERDIEYEFRSGCGGQGGALWIWMLPMLLLFVFWSSIARRVSAQSANGPNSPAMNFAKSRAKLHVESGPPITFGDVAGCEEAKEELEEVVDFLRDPEHVSRLGGAVPKGVLLVGPPGTGKTLLARAVAGEAGVAFFNLSGSDFVEMFVGVGAARVRDLFKQAQEQAPCIVFVDEIDAIGKSRSASQLQTNDEREQTLNALLVEMDGFDARSSVILLAATNRPEILDKALLRPGRFDRQVLVDRPDVRGRAAILAIHARKIVLDEQVDLALVAAQTPGFVGADLANVVNEAALLAARRGADAVFAADFQEAIERTVAGLRKKSRRLSPKEKSIVTYHESGHAIVAAATPEADPVHKVSIVSRGLGALGYTLQIPLEDRYLMTRKELLGRISVLLGGRAAEQLVFDEISTGASNDLERVTELARDMVTRYGMSGALGNATYAEQRAHPLLGDATGRGPHSEETAVTIDREVRRIIDERYDDALTILGANRALLESMSARLAEVEVLEGDELAAMLEGVEASP